MFIDQKTKLDLHGREFDCVVAGSGIVGIFVSVLLARSNLRVLNLPGGSLKEELLSSKLSVEGSSEFEIDSNFQRTRPRLIGGASQIWGGRIREFDPWDFQERVYLNSNQIQWPITWEEMKTLYHKTYNILNIESSIMKSESISARIEAKEYRVDELDFSGREIWLNEKNFFSNFRREIRSNPHLLLPEGFHYVAAKLDSRNSNDFDKIVRIVSKNNVQQEVKTKHLILAMGAVENSRHLLNIHANKKTIYNKENSALGHYFMVHLLAQFPHITKPNSDLNFHHIGNIQIRNTIQVRSNVQSELKLANSLASFAPQDLNVLSLSNISESRKRAIQRYGKRAPLEVLRRTDRLLPLLKESLKSSRNKSTPIGTSDGNPRMTMSLWSEQLPQEGNHIALSKRIDTHGNGSVEIKLNFTDFDIHSMSISASKIQQCLKDDPPTNLNSFYPINRRIVETALESGPTWGHQMGGTRMGNSWKDSVVDKNGECHTLSGIFVCGNSVFRSGSHAAPTLTALALSLKAIEEIKKRLDKSR